MVAEAEKVMTGQTDSSYAVIIKNLVKVYASINKNVLENYYNTLHVYSYHHVCITGVSQVIGWVLHASC